MASITKCLCKDCGFTFTETLGNLMTSTVFQCMKCGEVKYVDNMTLEEYDKICTKCSGIMQSGQIPICPKCHNKNVEEKYSVGAAD